MKSTGRPWRRCAATSPRIANAGLIQRVDALRAKDVSRVALEMPHHVASRVVFLDAIAVPVRHQGMAGCEGLGAAADLGDDSRRGAVRCTQPCRLPRLVDLIALGVAAERISEIVQQEDS